MPTLPNPPAIPELLTRPVDHPAKARMSGAAPAAKPLFADIGPALTIGLDFLFTTAAGGFLGWLLDYGLKWTPYGVVGGLLVGFVAATVRIIRRSQKLEQR